MSRGRGEEHRTEFGNGAIAVILPHFRSSDPVGADRTQAGALSHSLVLGRLLTCSGGCCQAGVALLLRDGGCLCEGSPARRGCRRARGRMGGE
jgi:hypothetical protein